MALRYIYGQEPVKDDSIGLTYNGFISDTILRNLGVQLVDGSMPGFVCIIGAADSDDQAFEIARDLQQKNILTLPVRQRERQQRDQTASPEGRAARLGHAPGAARP